MSRYCNYLDPRMSRLSCYQSYHLAGYAEVSLFVFAAAFLERLMVCLSNGTTELICLGFTVMCWVIFWKKGFIGSQWSLDNPLAWTA